MRNDVIAITETEKVLAEYKLKKITVLVTSKRFIYQDGKIAFSTKLSAIGTVLATKEGRKTCQIKLLSEDGRDLLKLIDREIKIKGEENIAEIVTALTNAVVNDVEVKEIEEGNEE